MVLEEIRATIGSGEVHATWPYALQTQRGTHITPLHLTHHSTLSHLRRGFVIPTSVFTMRAARSTLSVGRDDYYSNPPPHIMNKSFFVLIAGIIIAGSGATPALAYNLPEAVSTQSTLSYGDKEATFGSKSCIEGSFATNKTSSTGQSYLTVGNIAGGEAGYGFMLEEDMVYVTTHNGWFESRMPIVFLKDNDNVHFRACFIPGEGVRVDTRSSWLWSRSISQDFLPTTYAAANSALKVNVTQGKGVTVTVNSWNFSYNSK